MPRIEIFFQKRKKCTRDETREKTDRLPQDTVWIEFPFPHIIAFLRPTGFHLDIKKHNFIMERVTKAKIEYFPFESDTVYAIFFPAQIRTIRKIIKPTGIFRKCHLTYAYTERNNNKLYIYYDNPSCPRGGSRLAQHKHPPD